MPALHRKASASCRQNTAGSRASCGGAASYRAGLRAACRRAAACILLLALAFWAGGCKKPEPASWQQYSYPEYQGFLYIARTAQKDGTLHLAICGTFAGIEACVRTSHACTEEQFAALGPLLEGQGLTYMGECGQPDTGAYPDLSMYLSFIFSSDELHELWQSYGLEE